jgi:hypothetical protein
MFLVAPPDHPLAARERVSLHDLEKFPFVGYHEGMHTRSMIDALFKRMSLNIEYAIESSNSATIKQMVLAGMGLAFLPEIAVSAELRRGQLVRLDVPPLMLHQDVTLYTRKNRTPRARRRVRAVRKGLLTARSGGGQARGVGRSAKTGSRDFSRSQNRLGRVKSTSSGDGKKSSTCFGDDRRRPLLPPMTLVTIAMFIAGAALEPSSGSPAARTARGAQPSSRSGAIAGRIFTLEQADNTDTLKPCQGCAEEQQRAFLARSHHARQVSGRAKNVSSRSAKTWKPSSSRSPSRSTKVVRRSRRKRFVRCGMAGSRNTWKRSVPRLNR